MSTSRTLSPLLAGAAALALVLAIPSCDCNGGPPDEDGGQDAGGDGGGGGGDGGGGVVTDGGPTTQVLEFHGGPSRSGLYIDPAMTRASVGGTAFHRDTTFNGALTGDVYAQPLYFEDPSGPDLVIVATELNTVYALSAVDGSVVWQRSLPAAVVSSTLPCGNISPSHGITGTPAIDAAGRALYLSAMVNVGGQAHQQAFGLSLDDGANLPGWPVDMNVSARAGTITFPNNVQGARSAVSLMGGRAYFPYGGLAGDCGAYRGWVVGIPTANPGSVTAWTTRAAMSGIWAVGGLASDGASLYAATGNGPWGSSYGDQESVIRLGAGPTFSQQNQDFWRPTNWASLDQSDTDISGSGPVLVDLPGSTPSQLIVQLGKDGNAYLLNRNSLGGDGAQIGQLHIASNSIIQAAAVYRTSQGTYVAVSANGTGCPAGATGQGLIGVKVSPGSPPTLSIAWCAVSPGRSSPIVTTTDGSSESIVWTVGNFDGRLRGFNGDTGQLLYTSTDVMSGLHSFMAPILAKGRIFIAGDDRVYAYTR